MTFSFAEQCDLIQGGEHMIRCLWAESIVECLVMCGHTVLSHQPLHKTDSDWLMHLLHTNPTMKLDDLDIEDFKEFITNNHTIKE